MLKAFACVKGININVEILQKLPFNIEALFRDEFTEGAFNELALRVFSFQYANNAVYREYCDMICDDPLSIRHYRSIPFLPISFFKSHRVASFDGEETIRFSSSGTTGTSTSSHYVADLTIYERSFLNAFARFYGHPEDYVILGLLPSYLEREGSSLIYMVDYLIRLTKNPKSGFFLNNYKELLQTIDSIGEEKKIMLIGVSYALLDLAENYAPNLERCIVMETGGMKGKRKEMIKSDLHRVLCERLNLQAVHSEYGMTELLSQAYSHGNGIFQCPPWMKVLLREPRDPLTLSAKGSGGINVIDLANIWSCSFIATEDLGRIQKEGFEVLGRMDDADLRGCNLLIQ